MPIGHVELRKKSDFVKPFEISSAFWNFNHFRPCNLSLNCKKNVLISIRIEMSRIKGKIGNSYEKWKTFLTTRPILGLMSLNRPFRPLFDVSGLGQTLYSAFFISVKHFRFGLLVDWPLLFFGHFNIRFLYIRPYNIRHNYIYIYI